MLYNRYQARVKGVIEDIADANEYIHASTVAVAGIRYYITAFTVGNMDAAQTTRVNLVDGTGGSIIWAVPAGINGGGAVVIFPAEDPLEFTAGNGVVWQCEDAGALVTVSFKGFKRAES